MFGKRKYHRGKRITGSWIIGLVERGGHRRTILGICFKAHQRCVARDNTANVLKDSNIITDGWKGYIGIEKFRCTHLTLHLLMQFSNDEGSIVIHTNTLEGNGNGRSVKDL